jgi:benzoylformate decarboxylase
MVAIDRPPSAALSGDGGTPPGINFVSLAKGYGVEAAHAETAGDLKQALTAALGSQSPTLIEVPTLAEGF